MPWPKGVSTVLRLDVDMERIRRLYLDERRSIKAIAREMGVATTVVKRRLREMSIPIRNASHPWSDEETAYLKEHYSKLGPKQCAENLERSPGSLNWKAGALGLSCHGKRPGHRIPLTPVQKQALFDGRQRWLDSMSQEERRAALAKGIEKTHKARAEWMMTLSDDERSQIFGQRGEDHWNWRGGYVPYYGPDWALQRRKAKRRDNDTCQRCGYVHKKGKHDLEVHHIRPFREFGLERYEDANELSNLMTLCIGCHNPTKYHSTP